jgi:hypothetical protein
LPFPLLNAEPDLYAGVVHASVTPHVGAIDYFQVNVVPEPSTIVLAAVAFVGLVGLAWRRRKPD